MYDPFENRTYKYFYDDFNNCTGVEIEQSNETRFTMKKQVPTRCNMIFWISRNKKRV